MSEMTKTIANTQTQSKLTHLISLFYCSRNQKRIFIGLTVAALAFPIIFSGSTYLIFLACLLGIYMIVNSGLDLLFGYSGQISLGQAGFYAIGAYGSALISLKAGIPVFFSIILGASIAALVGFFLALPTVKLVHHFLALVTIGFGEIIRLLALNGKELTGGADGINFIPPLTLFGFKFTSNRYYYYFILLILLVLLVAKSSLVKSRVGRAMIAIRENPDAAEAFGIKLSRYKSLSFTVSAFYAGMGGALYAHMVRFISPESFSGEQSIMFLVMILIGGMGTFVGPVLGAALIIMTTEFLQHFGNYQMAIYGIIIIAVLFILPKGIVGTLNRSFQYLQYQKKGTPKSESR